ncbi:MAG: large subunit ribosomal protein L6 [Microgenomates group bacterium Gr01-1014_93]|nr:MAG: large subunit ribosomal protein L6 [Microgenomates group bacterium Gr01-1014_93]
MSRIGNALIQIPEGVTVENSTGKLKVKGPKGELDLNVNPKITVLIEDSIVSVTRKNEQKATKALHGLVRALIANMVKGVTEGWSKTIELVGVGFRAQGGGESINLTIGFSHTVDVKAPDGILFEIKDNTKVLISGIDKQLVGQVAANIRAIKPPEPYKGKGIRLEGEIIKRKAGKAGKVGVAGG